MQLKHERLTEGWVGFIRYHLSQGFIDKWAGDCINNPNLPTKHPLQLNSLAQYYRLNGGIWINEHSFKREFWRALNDTQKTADELWEEYLIPLTSED